MNRRTILLAVAALLITGVTFFLMRSLMNSQREQTRVVVQEKQPVKPKNEILVARKDLPAGHLVKPNDLEWRAWPEDGVAPSYIVKGKGDINEFMGAVVRSGIAMGEPISSGRVVKAGERGFMAAVLTPGTRAVSVPINAISGISGFVFPGDRVDLILTHTVGGTGRSASRVSETVLTNIRVLAVDQKTDDQNGTAKVAKTATFEVTPKQAEIVAVASQLGKLSLSLRSLAVAGQSGKGKATPGKRASRGRTYTRDREVSRLLRGGGPRSQPEDVVDVLRGSKTASERFGARK